MRRSAHDGQSGFRADPRGRRSRTARTLRRAPAGGAWRRRMAGARARAGAGAHARGTAPQRCTVRAASATPAGSAAAMAGA